MGDEELRLWVFAPTPHKPSFAQEFCLVKNFPTSRFTNFLWKWLRHRRIFWRFALKTAFGSGVFFAVPNKTAAPPHLSLRFLKGLIETLAKTTKKRYLSNQNFNKKTSDFEFQSEGIVLEKLYIYFFCRKFSF